MNDTLQNQILRYLTGEADAAEAAAVEARMEADPQLREVVRRLEDRLQNDDSGFDPDVDRAWQKLAARLELSDTGSSASGRGRGGRARTAPTGYPAGRRSRRRWAVAASVVLILGAAAIWSQGVLSGPDYAAIYATGVAERRAVRLPDGSAVELAPMAELRVPSDFADSDRRIELDGEAVFDVVHAADRPFLVDVERAVVRVVGTRFAVQARAGRPVRVAVEAGEVRFETPVGTARLGPDQTAHFDGTRLIRRADVSLAPYFGWLRGELHFENTPVPEVAETLSRWSPVTVVVADPALRDRTVSLVVRQRDLLDALRAASLALDIELRTQGDTIYLEPPNP